ncbi:alpha/beta hydrolase family protein [Aquincola tertiaricarbonis]|uniref:alpha/beta hydrolase family protein n=1 Tax=Aquincola tertiaricarbonis TaxID=391953 RepID=UPI0006990C44|nr:S9 family peptidase [Aquincola tertiaricarbonis]
MLMRLSLPFQHLLLACFMAGMAATSLAQQPAELPASAAVPQQRAPVAHYARLPMLSGMTLSPDGQRIAVLLNQEGRTVVATRPVAGGKLVPVLSTDNTSHHFNWARWVNNDRLVVSLRFASRRQFTGTVETRLVSVKADGSGVIDLTRFDRGSSITTVRRTQQQQDRVIDWLPSDGRHVLLQLRSVDSNELGVVRLNVETGARSTVMSPERGALRWLTDAQHRVRVGVFSDTDGHWSVRATEPQGGAWRTLWRFDKSEDGVWPMGFGTDPQRLYVNAQHEGRSAVFSVQLDDATLPRTLVLADARHDVGGSLLRAPLSGEVLGIAGAGPAGDDEDDGDGGTLWSPPWRALLKGLNQALPGRYNRIIHMAHDGQRFLLFSSGNGQPGQYFVGDRDKGTIALVADAYPELSDATLVGKQRTAIRARDGLPLNVYLTLPQGRKLGDGGAALPMVLLPHGGPHSRDDDDFDAWTEFLANRGHAVMQVNFRGSDGYGTAFKAAGLRRWGLEMQDDLTDAVQWAIGQRVADAGRVCIVGGSYGGYAALMGVVKTPELYRCAISFAGVSHLPDLILHQSEYIGGLRASDRMIGEFWGDRAQLRATSPALQAERIRVPVLLVHGTADRSVPVEQSREMAAALKSAGKPHRYIEQEGGDHHLSRHEHRLAFFEAMEQFLDQHLATPR